MTIGKRDLAYERSIRLEWLGREEPGTIGRLGDDPTLSGPVHKHDLGNGSARIQFGRVVDSLAYTNCYKVQLDGGMPTLPCVLGTHTATGAVGVRDMTTLTPGCNVWVLTHPQLYYGVIFAVEPQWMRDGSKGLSDYICQGSHVGFQVDAVHNFPLALDSAAGIVDWSAGRPVDSTTAGEWGVITETGLRFFLDSFMLQAAVNEACGIFGYLHDDLLRVAGYNLQIRTAGSEVEALDDQGEFRHVTGYAPFLWEAMGAFDPDTQIYREIDPEAVQTSTPWYGVLEPQQDNQQPFHRVQHYQGYLGQGGKRIVCGPPVEGRGELNTYKPENRRPYTGLFEEHISLTGAYTLRSAHSITHRKTLLIPVPRQIRRPEDTKGDNETNYSAAGRFGEGEEHKVSGSISAGGQGGGGDQITGDPDEIEDVLGGGSGGRDPLLRAAGVLDLHAFQFNWDAAHAFYYHREDWDLPEESSLDLNDRSQEIPSFDRLKSAQYLETPQPISYTVDHRYGGVSYYAAESYFTQLEDGGIAIGDGYGAEILLAGGAIFLSAPGDIFAKAGRSIVNWAGYDVILRAHNSIDATATEKDVRIKAEKNLQMLGGNGEEEGGILLESKTTAFTYDFEDKVGDDVFSTGIVMKSARSPIVIWGADIYARTGGGNVRPGDIILDADRGRRDVYTHADSIYDYSQRGVYQFFGREGDVQSSNEFTPNFCLISTPQMVDGYQLIDGDQYNRGWLYCASGHIATELSEQYDGLVAVLQGEGASAVQRAIANGVERENDISQFGGDLFDNVLEQFWYEENRGGNDTVIETAGFSLRTTEQYRTTDFKLYEDRWQQMARASGASVGTWSENAVEAGGEETYPYPGRAAWKEQSALKRLDLKLYDLEQGRANDRGGNDDYTEPEFNEPDETKLDGNYSIIRGS